MLSICMMMHASHLTDMDLTAALVRLAQNEREATVDLIVHLAEFDARRLYEGAGFSSLFKYCRAVLRLSEGATYNRIESARAARRYPVIVDMLIAGALSPTTARLLARHLTPENHEELLEAARGKGRRDVEELLARRFPKPDVVASVRKLPAPRLAPLMAAFAPNPPAVGTIADETPPPFGAAGLPPATPVGFPAMTYAPERHEVVRPLAPDRYEVRFAATTEMRDQLRLAQDLLSHAIPSGNVAEVIERALRLLVEDLTRRKLAWTALPRISRGQSETSRHIPAAVRRVVWLRDGGQCAFVSSDGHRCGETRFIEFHHVVPYAAGGLPTVENIQLRCRAHNGHEAFLFYGRDSRPARVDGV
jgi:hypothetical protein